jgi:osmotically-inducible protein OsmY
MKYVLIFLLGAIAGGAALHLYQRRANEPADHPVTATNSPAANAAKTAAGVQDALAEKLKEWKLTPADIKEDLTKTGQVVRAKAQEMGGRIDDARVVAVIKAKYVLDSELSARAINVASHDGEVTLTGTASSAELIGRAVALALDTHGVHNVVSRLTVQN